jgi:hypothetical protein
MAEPARKSPSPSAFPIEPWTFTGDAR